MTFTKCCVAGAAGGVHRKEKPRTQDSCSYFSFRCLVYVVACSHKHIADISALTAITEKDGLFCPSPAPVIQHHILWTPWALTETAGEF